MCLIYVDMQGLITHLQKILPISASLLSSLVVFLSIFILKKCPVHRTLDSMKVYIYPLPKFIN